MDIVSADLPTCPTCNRVLEWGGFVLMLREDDGKRTCRSLWGCVDSHQWWMWADRPESTLEPCPYPELFGS
ncbi:dehydrogenase [Actinomadura meridiana]|uniref:Dehydrogenase n=1 Tax=Actinomadura meridiana TaxID=559626 RepID=A0ABP8CEV6_9ACTN